MAPTIRYVTDSFHPGCFSLFLMAKNKYSNCFAKNKSHHTHYHLILFANHCVHEVTHAYTTSLYKYYIFHCIFRTLLPLHVFACTLYGPCLLYCDTLQALKTSLPHHQSYVSVSTQILVLHSNQPVSSLNCTFTTFSFALQSQPTFTAPKTVLHTACGKIASTSLTSKFTIWFSCTVFCNGFEGYLCLGNDIRLWRLSTDPQLGFLQ